ncbi:hypothetical protein LCGC14_0979390 [marine sediment metagenome]|uniref:Uncharacterized protein n=1 Tax=marine sediment metagenome TaxID=412755 RepID=A0A0F9NDN1_9ZZZZ
MSLGTILRVSQQDAGQGEIITADVTFGPNYQTNGEPITAQKLGFRVGSELNSVSTSQEGDRGFEYEQDPDPKKRHQGKLLAYEETAGKIGEVLNGTDLSGVTVRVTAVGR